MKKILLISFLFSLFILQSQSQDFSIVGTWKQVSFELIKNGNSLSTSTNSGNYSLHGNHYTENIKVHVSPAYEGKELRIHMELNGDTLTQVFPVNDRWSYDKENCRIEKFVKVD